MDSNYKVAYNVEWEKLKQLDPLDVVKRLEVKYCEDKKQFVVPFFEEYYILDFDIEAIYRIKDNKEPTIEESIIILNYLTYSTDYIVNTNKWVSLKEIPNGGALFYPTFYKSSISKLISTFGMDIEGFKESARKLKGHEASFGDAAYEFKILPKISICIAIWEGDEEISPNATILFEAAIEHLVHIETVIGVGMSVTQRAVANKKYITSS